MAKLVMRREGTRLTCPSISWAEMLMELPEGVDLNVTATRARSVRQNGTYWGLLTFVVDQGPEWMSRQWPTKDELSDALQLETGFVRQIKLASGLIYAVPASKSFEEMSQEKFNGYFEAAHKKLIEWCNYDPLPLYTQWLQDRHGRLAA